VYLGYNKLNFFLVMVMVKCSYHPFMNYFSIGCPMNLNKQGLVSLLTLAVLSSCSDQNQVKDTSTFTAKMNAILEEHIADVDAKKLENEETKYFRMHDPKNWVESRGKKFLRDEK